MDLLPFLMAVQAVNINSVAFLKAEDNPPVGPHRYCPEARTIAFQLMQPEPGQVHVLRSSGRIEPREDIPPDQPMCGMNAAFVSLLEKASERPASEAPYHSWHVICIITHVKSAMSQCKHCFQPCRSKAGNYP